jgi:hypothetical protein
MTDHRPIIGRIILKPPDRNSARCLAEISTPVLNNPRIKFPGFKDKHLFQQFREETDVKIKQDALHESLVTGDASFVSLYRQVTNIVNQTAAQVFGRIKGKSMTFKKPLPTRSSSNYKAGLAPLVVP